MYYATTISGKLYTINKKKKLFVRIGTPNPTIQHKIYYYL